MNDILLFIGSSRVFEGGGKNHVCFTRIFEIERGREREKDGREGLLFQRLEKGRVRERGSEETSTRGKEGN